MRNTLYSKYISMAAVCAMLFGGISCSKDAQDDFGSTPPLAVAAVSVSAPEFAGDTRVTLNPTDLIKWYSSDKSYAGLYSPGKGIVKSVSTGSTISSDGFNATFQFESTNITSFTSDAARIIYPCTKEAKDASSFAFSIPASQTLNAKAGSVSRYGSSSCVPMISDAFAIRSTLTETTYPVGYKATASASAQMHLLSSIVAFYVYDSEGTYAAEKVKAVEMKSSSVGIAAPSSVELTADNELPQLVGTSTSAVAQFSSSSYYFPLNGVTSKETSAPIYLSIIPAEFAGEIVVVTDKGKHVFPFETPKKFNRAEVKDMSLNLSSPKAAVKPIPSLQIVNINRASVSGRTGKMVTMTVKLDENCAGFYAQISTKQIKTVSEMLNQHKYLVGQPDDDYFTANADGTVNFQIFMGNSFTFSALSFDASGDAGIGQSLGDNGYGYPTTYNVTKDGDVPDIDEDMVYFNN
ncbi:MAG: hypothetical protein J6K28_01055 [Alistipes sp.]|nr:hypothetical protein [Alistipes sp.]